MKTIKSDADYADALAEIERLVETDPVLGTAEADRLEILTLLVRDFESRRFPRSSPTPLDALRFRMEQQGLSQRDLVPFFGSRSKVSEVLSGKRPLTLSMIRALYSGLGIPAEALLQDQPPSLIEDDAQLDWARFPIREMVARKWVDCKSQSEIRDDPEAIVRRFLAPLGGPAKVHALYKRTRRVRSGRSMDRHALAAWTIRVVIRGLESSSPRYIAGSVTKDFMREVV